MKKHIPNSITCCNLICGCIATVCAAHAYEHPASYVWAVAFIILGAVFDFFDGMTARLLSVSSPSARSSTLWPMSSPSAWRLP